jgi:hypothetical protein
MSKILSCEVVSKSWDSYVSKKTGEEVKAGNKKVMEIKIEHDGQVITCQGYMGNGNELRESVKLG